MNQKTEMEDCSLNNPFPTMERE